VLNALLYRALFYCVLLPCISLFHSTCSQYIYSPCSVLEIFFVRGGSVRARMSVQGGDADIQQVVVVVKINF
jgi:hypothetical protein